MQKAKNMTGRIPMALFGSDTDKKVKKESAATEPAWTPVAECDKPELFVWRVVKFKIEHWPKDDYGKFYSGDSYIVLNVYKDSDSDQLLYDVHFWIGKYSTQDEYGTAAYKTVELDTFLDDRPVQHREVMNHESELFKSYFNSITYLKGGADSGFRHVETKEYKPRLLHFCGNRKQIVVKEVKASRNSLNSMDVYVLDLGTELYQWNGSSCNKDEKFKAVQYVQNLKSERHGAITSAVVDEDDTVESDTLKDKLSDASVKQKSTGDGETNEKVILKVSDATGSLERTEVARNVLDRSLLTNDDVYIIDNGQQVFVYIGSGCSVDEKRNAIAYAHEYLKDTVAPLSPVTVISANQTGRSAKQFAAAFD